MPLFSTLLYVAFVLSSSVLVVAILLQERGPGAARTGRRGATVGARSTPPHAAHRIHRITGVAVGVFLVTALLVHTLNR